MRRVWGWVLAVTAFVACPCHLPLTLPLLIGLLSGTAVGGFVAANTGWVYGLATGYFIVGIGAGIYLLKRRRAPQGTACALPQAVEVNGHRRRKSTRKRSESVGRRS